LGVQRLHPEIVISKLFSLASWSFFKSCANTSRFAEHIEDTVAQPPEPSREEPAFHQAIAAVAFRWAREFQEADGCVTRPGVHMSVVAPSCPSRIDNSGR
jgi:hypothetical protein